MLRCCELIRIMVDERGRSVCLTRAILNVVKPWSSRRHFAGEPAGKGCYLATVICLY